MHYVYREVTCISLSLYIHTYTSLSTKCMIILHGVYALNFPKILSPVTYVQMGATAWILEPDFLDENAAQPTLRCMPFDKFLIWTLVSLSIQWDKDTIIVK